jgi:hypothetical protein
MIETPFGTIRSAYLWLRRGQAARSLSRRRFLRALSDRQTTLGPAPDDHGSPESLVGELVLRVV